ncbi:MAG: hypothetical protein NTY53_18725 [Kiritimatiellaeota bacterium]|nr:hypothetical protein [Kiritimatiellota bacterium]
MITLVAFDFAQKVEKSITPAEVAQARAAGLFCWADVEGESIAAVKPLLKSLAFPVEEACEALQPDHPDTFDVLPDSLHFAVRETRLRRSTSS